MGPPRARKVPLGQQPRRGRNGQEHIFSDEQEELRAHSRIIANAAPGIGWRSATRWGGWVGGGGCWLQQSILKYERIAMKLDEGKSGVQCVSSVYFKGTRVQFLTGLFSVRQKGGPEPSAVIPLPGSLAAQGPCAKAGVWACFRSV